MRPSWEILAANSPSYPAGININITQLGDFSHNFSINLAKLWKFEKECPKGTIPIRRDDQNNSTIDHFSGSLKWNHGTEFAGIYSKPRKIFYSAEANIAVWNPILSSNQQYSSAAIFIESGDASLQEQIQVGWTVNPQLYGDSRTRFYTAWKGLTNKGGKIIQGQGCFNVKCPGFVIVSNKIPLDFVFDKTSAQEGTPVEVAVKVFQDPKVGWWLVVNNVRIGYWPISLFITLQDSADSVRFGGQIYTPVSDNVSPWMGSGMFSDRDYDKTSYMRRVMVATDENRVVSDVDNSFFGGVQSRCYLIGDNSFKNSNDRYSFVFGGKGGVDKETCLY